MYGKIKLYSSKSYRFSFSLQVNIECGEYFKIKYSFSFRTVISYSIRAKHVFCCIFNGVTLCNRRAQTEGVFGSLFFVCFTVSSLCPGFFVLFLCRFLCFSIHIAVLPSVEPLSLPANHYF